MSVRRGAGLGVWSDDILGLGGGCEGSVGRMRGICVRGRGVRTHKIWDGLVGACAYRGVDVEWRLWWAGGERGHDVCM